MTLSEYLNKDLILFGKIRQQFKDRYNQKKLASLIYGNWCLATLPDPYDYKERNRLADAFLRKSDEFIESFIEEIKLILK